MFFSASILNVIGSLNPSILGWTVTMIPSFFVGWEQNCIEPLPWSYFLRRPGNLRSLEHFRLKINFPSESIAIISHWSLTLFNEEDLHVLTWYQRKVNYYCINTFSDIFIAFGTFPRISRTLKLSLLMLTMIPTVWYTALFRGSNKTTSARSSLNMPFLILTHCLGFSCRMDLVSLRTWGISSALTIRICWFANVRALMPSISSLT